MPPKKSAMPKPPVVVGTVSTRSTKRESVVNIEIVPKTTKTTRRSFNKSLKGSPKSERTSPRKALKKDTAQLNESELEDVAENPIKGNSAVLDLLKDWSDEDSNSSPSSAIPVSSESSSDYHIVFEESVSQEKSELLSADQQNLIEILEGTPQSSPNVTKKEFQGDYRNSGSIEIIEECIIEDAAVIIESSEDNSNSEELETSNIKDIKAKDAGRIEDDTEVEIVSKYKYSEIPTHLRGKTHPSSEKLPMKKRLLQVVVKKNDTYEPENSVKEGSYFHNKSVVSTAMEVDRSEQFRYRNVELAEETVVDAVDHNVNLNNEESVPTTTENKSRLPKATKTLESIENQESTLIEDNVELADIPVETMEVCEEQVINEEIIDSQFDTAEVNGSNIELTQLSVSVVPSKNNQSYAESVKDLERILSDEPEIRQTKANPDKKINIFEKKTESSSKKRRQKEKLQDEADTFEILEKPRARTLVKNKISPGKPDILDMPTLEDKSPGKKSFSAALSQLDAVPSTPKSKKIPGKLKKSLSDTSPRTRRSQTLLSEAFDRPDKNKIISEGKVSPGKLKKSISDIVIAESSRNESKSRNNQSEPISPKNQMEIDLKTDSGFKKDGSQESNSLKDVSDLNIQMKADSFTEISRMEVDLSIQKAMSAKIQSSLVDIPVNSNSKKSIDSKVETSSNNLLRVEKILENIYHPKPQVNLTLTKSLSARVEKYTPRLQTAEDILTSIYNPKPHLSIPQTSPSDSSTSEGKKENDPSTPIAEGTFDFDEISSSSSIEVKKTYDKFEEKELTSASETENMGEVSSSFGDLNLNSEKKPRGRPKKSIQQGIRKSSRNKEKEEDISKTKNEDLLMDTLEINEGSSSSGAQIETSIDTELKNLEELKISSEMSSDTAETRPKTPKISKKIYKEDEAGKEPRNKPSKDSKKKKKGNEESDNDKRSESAEDLRRSSRIKTIAPVKKKSHGLVKSKSEPILNESDVSDNSLINESEKGNTPTTSPKPIVKEKKTRWSSAKESLPISPLAKTDNTVGNSNPVSPGIIKPSTNSAAIIKQRLKSFIHLKENQFKTDRQVSKEAKEMICDCYLAEEDIKKDEYGCGEDCLNRLLMIECGELCQVGERCTNKRFQNKQMAPVEVFHTDKKGLGIKAAANIPYGEFILEYVGEVLGKEEFDKRAEIYSEDKNIHHYFMSLRPDAIIDATLKGNISRFINHSCEPNAETQKWTVNGELRIGFFSTRTILAGEEVTFDYQFERYGREAQKCYCEAPSCRGWLGDSPDASEDEEEEEEEIQKPLEKTIQKDDRIAQSIESAISAALAKEFGTEASLETTSGETADVEKKTDETAAATAVGIEIPTPVKPKKKIRKDIFEDLDQLKEELEMLATTGLKNQQHTLKLSRLMVRAKDPEQRKKLLHVLRRGELPCRRLFLDYHGLRLIHGYIVDAEQLAKANKQFESSKLELLQTLAVLPIQNRTILIESKVLPAVEKMSGKHGDKSKKESLSETEEEIRFLAKKLLEGWMNLKESFRIPKKQRIEQMKEHEKEANKKFMESRNRVEEEESYRKSEARYRSSWSRYKSERESSNKKGSKQEDKDKPSAEFLRISKQERRKLFALQMELKEHERRLKQREMWRQHEMNCMMIGADPRFTAPFDPSKGFQYVWNPSIGQWQALPAPVTQDIYAATRGNRAEAQTWGAYPGQSMISTIPMLPSTHAQLPGLNIPGLQALPEVTQTQPPLPSTPPVFLDVKKEEEDPSQVKFAGPIPPPAKLPPKWKCAKDKYGRPYYYHIKIRKSQWEPPPIPEEVKLPESPSESSSSESSSLSSDSSSDSDSDGDIDDDKLLLEVRKQIDTNQTISQIKKEEDLTPSPEVKAGNSEEDETMDQSNLTMSFTQEPKESSWLDIRLKEQFNLEADEAPPHKKKRPGLCSEVIISPRTEEDRLQFKEDIKRYKANKEKLKRQKELQLQRSKQKRKLKVVLDESETKKLKDKHLRTSVKNKIKEIQSSGDDAKKIKESFRTNLAGTVVNVLNAYRKPDCKVAKITNTEDFKHLARKLTHFVMLKELKHLDKIEDLTCTDSVKAKAREYIKKYMSKFGELYYKRHDEPDFKD